MEYVVFPRAKAALAASAGVKTLGGLRVSIAHEISQPLAAIAANGDACRRWLEGPAPNLEEARESVSGIVDDANRAGDIIKRIRTLVRKAETPKVPLEINDGIRQGLARAQGGR